VTTVAGIFALPATVAADLRSAARSRTPSEHESPSICPVLVVGVALDAGDGQCHLGAVGTAVPAVPGQPGKDVVWVPTPLTLVDKMLAMHRSRRRIT